MKKMFLLLALAAGMHTFAQENSVTDTVAVKSNNYKLRWYVGFGAVFNPDYNINENLKQAGVHRIADVMPGFVLGWDALINEKVLIDTEFNFAGMYNDFKDDGYRLIQGSIAIRGQYAIVNASRTSLMAGLGLSYTGNNLSVFDTNTTIDVNNLTPSQNTGYVSLYNQSFYIGPVVSLRLLKKQGYNSLTLKAGYDINLSNSRWKSEFANVTNTVRENGNRFYVNLTIPFHSKWE